MQALSEIPFISVVLPVRNEHKTLPGLIREMLEQDYPCERFEIIVADGCSTDGTRELVEHLAAHARVSLRVVRNEGIRSGPGRNAGVRAARGEVILFIDGHCALPSRRLLRDTASLLRETGADCLCRPQPLLAPVPTRMGRAIAAVRASWLGHGRDSLIYDMKFSGFVDPTTSGATYRREVFDLVGFYDERFDACEDCDFNLRVRKQGLRAYTDPRLAVYYEPRATWRGLWKQMIRYGRGRVRLMRKHPDYASAAQIAPMVLLVFFVLALPAALLPMPWSVLFWIPVALFLAACAVVSVQLARAHGLGYLWRAPAVLLGIYLGLGAGLLLEYCGL